MTSDTTPAQMPDTLQAILNEPGWERHPSFRGPDWFEYFGINPDEQRGGHDVVQVWWNVDDGWTCGFFPFNCGVVPKTIYAAAALMSRIERALSAGDGTARERVE